MDNKGKQRSVIRNPERYFCPSISWSDISSNSNSFKVYPKGFIFDVCGMSCFDAPNRLNLLGVLNTKFYAVLSHFLNPTMHFQIGNFKQLPYMEVPSKEFDQLVEQNIAISRADWDAHETSWDFQRNELLSIDTSTYTENIDYKIEKHFEETGEHISISPAAPQLGSLEWRMEQYKTKWERKFMQLHKNEEELNRQFIDIYGLQDELTPDVPLNEITILQQGEISIVND